MSYWPAATLKYWVQPVPSVWPTAPPPGVPLTGSYSTVPPEIADCPTVFTQPRTDAEPNAALGAAAHASPMTATIATRGPRASPHRALPLILLPCRSALFAPE